jgi:uncharacterized Zn finger protein (UPF0148 family)
MADDASTRKISIRCRCGKQLTGPATAIGHTIICPACGKRLRLASGAASARQPSQHAPSAPPSDEYGIDTAKQAVESSSCPNCGASLPAGAVLCVECGYDLRQGQVLSRTAAPKPKKKRKKQPWFRLVPPSPAVWGIGAGSLVLIGVAVLLTLRGGSPNAAAGTGVAGASRAAARPEPSKDPKDWRSSFAAFAASLSAQTVSGPSQYELHSGPVSLADESGKIAWEGMLMGRDRRPIAGAAGADRSKHAFGIRFSDPAALAEPFVLLFAIDESRAQELLGLSYRRVRIEGQLDPTPRVVWLDKDGRISSVVAGRPLQTGEATTFDPPERNGIRPLYVMWFNITRFEAAH